MWCCRLSSSLLISGLFFGGGGGVFFCVVFFFLLSLNMLPVLLCSYLFSFIYIFYVTCCFPVYFFVKFNFRNGVILTLHTYWCLRLANICTYVHTHTHHIKMDYYQNALFSFTKFMPEEKKHHLSAILQRWYKITHTHAHTRHWWFDHVPWECHF